MTIKVNFFNNTEYEYYAEDFNRQFMYLVSTNGVADKNSFPVGPQGTPNGTVTVGTGAAWWNGQFIYSDSAEILSITPNETLEERIDCVVLNIDKLNLNASLEVVTKGLTTDDMIILAEINMPGSTSIVTQGQITDCRNFVTIKDELVQKFHDFFKKGGEVGGTITFPRGVTRQVQQIIGMRDKVYTQRSGLSNYNGYPTWSAIIEDPDNDNNTNGLLFMLGTGSGDAYNDNYLRPLKMGYAQKNNIGSANVPWDDIFLRGVSNATNGYTKLPNGLIIQWGRIIRTGADAKTWELYPTFPIAFPNACWTVIGEVSSQDSNTNARLTASYVVPLTKVQFKTRGGSIGLPYDSTIATTEIDWVAIGY